MVHGCCIDQWLPVKKNGAGYFIDQWLLVKKNDAGCKVSHEI